MSQRNAEGKRKFARFVLGAEKKKLLHLSVEVYILGVVCSFTSPWVPFLSASSPTWNEETGNELMLP